MATIAQLYQIAEGGQVAPAKLIQWLLNPTFAQGTFDGVTIGASNPQNATFKGVVISTGGLSILGGGLTVVGTTSFSAIDNTPIGQTTPAAGGFTTISGNSTTNITPVLSFNASNTIGSFGTTTAGSYNQLILQNKSATANASSNYVVSNNLGTDTTYYAEMGMNSSAFSAGTPADFFSINNGIYFSGHDGPISVGSGNGQNMYLAWGTTGQSSHVINVSGALGFSTNLSGTPGTSGFGTAGQALISGGSAAAPAWGTLGVAGGGTGVATLSGVAFGNGTAAFTAATNAQMAAAIGTLPVLNGGTGVTTSTGSGNNVLSNSPTLVTPALGTPSALVLTNATGLPVAGGGTGVATLSGVAFGNGTAAFTAATGSQIATALGANVAQANLAANVAGNGPAFSAYQSTLQSVPSGTYTKLQLQTKEFDTASAFDAVTNYRFQPAVAGYYQFTGLVYYASAVQNASMVLYKNGVRFKDGPNTSLVVLSGGVDALVFLNGSTDYIEAFVYQTSGGAVNTANFANQTYLQGFLARAQ